MRKKCQSLQRSARPLTGFVERERSGEGKGRKKEHKGRKGRGEKAVA